MAASVGLPKVCRLQKRNLCIIFSNRFDKNVSEDDLTPLPFHRHDEERIATTFSWLNFDIWIKPDMDKIDLEDEIDDLVGNEDLTKEHECVVIFFLSHGNTNGKIQTNDIGYISTDWLVKKFITSKNFVGKPKMFFFQACRGAKPMRLVKSARAAGEGRVAEKADAVIFYATTEDNFAYADPDKGGFFINTLCDVLQAYGGNYDLFTITSKVNELLSTSGESIKDEEANKVVDYVQVSELSHTLTCHLYFTPVEDDYGNFLEKFKKSEKFKALKVIIDH